MGEVELRLQQALDLPSQAVAILPAADEDVGGERVETGRDPPHVQIVDARHSGDGDDRLRDGPGVDVRRRLLHQDRGRVAQDAPRAPDYQQRDRNRDDRVDDRPAGRQDDQRCDEDARRAEQVGDHVALRGFDVQALSLRAHEDHRRDAVHREARERHDQHPATEDLGRVPEPLNRLPDDPAAHDHEREPVDERCQDLGPLEARSSGEASRGARRGSTQRGQGRWRTCRTACGRHPRGPRGCR